MIIQRAFGNARRRGNIRKRNIRKGTRLKQIAGIKALDVKDAKRFVEFAKENNFGKIVAQTTVVCLPVFLQFVEIGKTIK